MGDLNENNLTFCRPCNNAGYIHLLPDRVEDEFAEAEKARRARKIYRKWLKGFDKYNPYHLCVQRRKDGS